MTFPASHPTTPIAASSAPPQRRFRPPAASLPGATPVGARGRSEPGRCEDPCPKPPPRPPPSRCCDGDRLRAQRGRSSRPFRNHPPEIRRCLDEAGVPSRPSTRSPSDRARAPSRPAPGLRRGPGPGDGARQAGDPGRDAGRAGEPVPTTRFSLRRTRACPRSILRPTAVSVPRPPRVPGARLRGAGGSCRCRRRGFGFGSAFRAYGDALVPALGPRLRRPRRRAVPLASKRGPPGGGLASAAHGEVVDAAWRRPLYMRDKVASPPPNAWRAEARRERPWQRRLQAWRAAVPADGEADLGWLARDAELYPVSVVPGQFCRFDQRRLRLLGDARRRRAVGYGVLMMVIDEAHILNISVVAAASAVVRRRLLGHFADVADQRARRLLLEVRPSNGPALALYERAGFQTIGRRRAITRRWRRGRLVMSPPPERAMSRRRDAILREMGLSAPVAVFRAAEEPPSLLSKLPPPGGSDARRLHRARPSGAHGACLPRRPGRPAAPAHPQPVVVPPPASSPPAPTLRLGWDEPGGAHPAARLRGCASAANRPCPAWATGRPTGCSSAKARGPRRMSEVSPFVGQAGACSMRCCHHRPAAGQ